MTDQPTSVKERAELFDEPLVSRLTSVRRHRDRRWLADEIDAHLDNPDCRVVVLTGAPGAGKSVVMAQLARKHPDWPRYFIRRIGEADGDLHWHEGSLASFLTQIGLQLLALRPELFPDPDPQLVAELETDVVEAGADVSVVRVAEWITHPFRRDAVRARLKAAYVKGRASVLEIGKLIADAADIKPAALERPALEEPLRKLADDNAGERVVVLLDGLDELRFRDAATDVGQWLTRHQRFPANLRIVVATRPDTPLLRELTLGHKEAVREVPIPRDSAKIRQDVEGYLRDLAGEPEVSAVLTLHGISGERFAGQVSPKSGGNFLYLDMIARLLDAEAAHRRPSLAKRPPMPDLDWLDSLETLPDDLPRFYALLLWSLHNRLGGIHWDDLYHPLLGLLTVAERQLTGHQFRAFGEISLDQAAVDGALDRLQFFLDGNETAGFRLHHTAMADFLADAATERTDPALYCNEKAWHSRLADHAIRVHQEAATWRDADPYLQAWLPLHAAEAGRVDDLVEDPRYLLATDPDVLVPELGAVGRSGAAALVYQQVVPMIRDGDLTDARAHLKLYAEQAHLYAFAARIPMDPATSPWLIDFTRWDAVQLRQVLGRHDTEVDAVAIARDRDGDPLAVTGGADGRIRVWDLRPGREMPSRALPDPSDETARLTRVTALATGELDSGDTIAVSGGLDGAVRVWNLATGLGIGEPLIGAENSGFGVAAANIDGALQAVCRTWDDFRAWDLITQATAHTPFTAADVLKEEPMAASGWGSQMVFAAVVRSDGPGGAVRVWDTMNGAPCGPPIETADNWISALELAEVDGTLLAAVADGDRGIQIFDVATGRPVTRRTLDIGLPLVTALAIGTIGGHLVLAAGDESGEIRFRELASLQRFGDPVRAHSRRVTALGFGAGDDDDLLASVGKDDAPSGMSLPVSARIWKPGKHGRKLHPVAPPINLRDAAGSVALGRVAGRLEAVTADGRRVFRWDVSAGTAIGTPLGGGYERVCAVGVATVAGRTVAVSATYDKATIRTWDIPAGTAARHPVTGQPLIRQDIETVRGLAVTRLGDKAVAVCAGWGAIHVWDAATGEPAGAGLITGLKNVLSLAVGELAGQSIVACACGSPSEQGVLMFNLETGAKLDMPQVPRPEAVAIARDRGKTLVVCGGSSLTLTVWDPASSAKPTVIRTAGETLVLAATHISGHPMAVCSGRKGEIRLVDLTTIGPDPSPVADPLGEVNDLAIAVVGGHEVVICATDHGIRVLDPVTGEDALPPPGGRPSREAIAVAAGTLHGRPVAVAGGYPNYAWYLDSGEPLRHQPPWPEPARSVALSDIDGRTVAVVAMWNSQVIVADLATGSVLGPPVTSLPGGLVESVGVLTVSGRPILVARVSMGITARYLDLPWLPPRETDFSCSGFAEQEETPPPPALFPARRLTRYPHDGGWCMALGSFEGQPVVLSGHDNGEIDVFEVASGLPLLPPLRGGQSAIGALGYRYLGVRPVIAAGAIDGVVRIADLTDLSTLTIVRTLAPVKALALAAPDHCLIGTEKGLLGIRIPFPAQPGQRTGTRGRSYLPADIRAARTCPWHDSHQQEEERAGQIVPRICLKGVQLTWGARKADSLSYPAGHCYIMPGRLEIVAAARDEATQPLTIDLAGAIVELVDDPEAYLRDGCHFGVAIHGDCDYRVLSCYRRSERDWLVTRTKHAAREEPLG